MTAFRGSHRPLPKVVVYSAEAGTVDLSPFVASLDTQKGIGGEPGTWRVSLKLAGIVGLPDRGVAAAKAFDRIEDDDWVLLSIDDGVAPEHIMLGLVDSLTEDHASGMNGVATRTWQLQGRDFTKVLAETDVGALPLSNARWFSSHVAWFDVVNALSAQGPLNPGTTVGTLVAFALRLDQWRVEGQPHWRLPVGLPFGDTAARARPDRQFGDVLDRRWIDTGLEGDLSAIELLNGAPTHPVKALDIIQGYANDRFCEFFCDLRTPDRGPWHPSTPGSTAPADGSATTVRSYRANYPAVILRERPFPVHPATVAHRAPDRNPSSAWAQLLTHEVDAADLVAGPSLGRGRERINYWAATSGPAQGFDRYGLQLALIAGLGGISLRTAPAGDRDSIARHGWRRMEVESRYIDGTADGILTSTRWTHLLRDWYWGNHRFLSGQVRLHRLYPEIRVGERLRIRLADGRSLLAYIEGVSHTWRIGQTGATQGSTTLDLTRGTLDAEHILPPEASV